MLVEDTDQLRRFLIKVLENAGYTVLSADSGPNALILAAETKGRIDLLLTDWDMPEMSGIALGKALKLIRPDVRVMQMSGGAHDTMMVMNYGWAFLEKPFIASKLLKMISDVLNSVDRSQLGGESFNSRLDTKPNGSQTRDPENHPAESNESQG